MTDDQEAQEEGITGEPATNIAKVPVALVVDTSGSMGDRPASDRSGDTKIEQLNKGLEQFKDEVEDEYTASNAVDVSLITFDSSVEVINDFTDIEQWDPPTLSAGGVTSMSEAIIEGQNHIEDYQDQLDDEKVTRKKALMWVLTDGKPTDNSKSYDQTHTYWDVAQACVRDGTEDGDILFYGVGIGDDDATQKLEDLVSDAPDKKVEIFQIEEDVFQELFKVISESATGHSQGGDTDDADELT